MEREYNETAAELMQEVSLSVPAISEPSQTLSSPLSMFSSPSSIPQSVLQTSTPILTTPTSVSLSQGANQNSSAQVFAFQDSELQEMRNRFRALKNPSEATRITSSSGTPVGFDFQSRDQT